MILIRTPLQLLSINLPGLILLVTQHSTEMVQLLIVPLVAPLMLWVNLHSTYFLSHQILLPSMTNCFLIAIGVDVDHSHNNSPSNDINTGGSLQALAKNDQIQIDFGFPANESNSRFFEVLEENGQTLYNIVVRNCPVAWNDEKEQEELNKALQMMQEIDS